MIANNSMKKPLTTYMASNLRAVKRHMISQNNPYDYSFIYMRVFFLAIENILNGIY